MKWQQRIRVTTGLSCWQIMLHLLVIAFLVAGWLTGTLVQVGIGLCALYTFTLASLFALQRARSGWRRECRDFLEELTTTWYFGTAIIVLWLLARVVHNNLLLAAIGLVLLAGPAVVSLLTKDRRQLADFAENQHVGD